MKNSLQSLIVPIPCYNGLYDNFDNNKILVSATDENGNATFENPNVYDKSIKSYIENQLPLKNELRNYTNEDKTYDTYGGWELFETERDLMNFEVPELIANRTPLGVNLGKAFRTICDSTNISTKNIEDTVSTLDKTYFMLKEIPQTYGNISESDKDFYPNELDLKSNWLNVSNTYGIYFNNYDNPTKVEITNTIEGGQNAHVKISPSFRTRRPARGVTINSVYGYSITNKGDNDTWCIWEKGKQYLTSWSNFNATVVYYIFTLEDKTTHHKKMKIYPLLAGGKINYGGLEDSDLNYWIKRIVEFRTNYIFKGDGEGITTYNEDYDVDYRYLFSTWTRNRAVEEIEGSEFVRNEIDIYLKGFDNEYDLTVSTMGVTMLSPTLPNMWGNTSEQDEEYYSKYDCRYYDYYNILKGAKQHYKNLNYEEQGDIIFKAGELKSKVDGEFDFYTKKDIYAHNSNYTGYMDFCESREGRAPDGMRFDWGLYKMNLDGLFLQTDYVNPNENRRPYVQADINSNFKVSTYVGSEDITIATISKDILKQVNVKDIFLNTLKMLNLTLMNAEELQNEVEVYENGEYATSISVEFFKNRKDEFPKGTTFKFLYKENAYLNDKFEWFVPLDIYWKLTELEIKDINKKIDRNSIEIVPSILESCEYDYSLRPIESYANEIRQYHLGDYQTKKNIYKYEHNTSIIDSLKDVTFKTTLDYKLKSVWFNENMLNGDTNHQYLAFNKGAQFTQSLFNTSGEELSSVQVQNSGALYALKNLEISQFVEDSSSRLCMFDKESALVDFENCLVCYNGFEERKMPITITDDIPAAQQINNNFCYVLYPRRGTINRGKVVWDVNLGLLKDAMMFILNCLMFLCSLIMLGIQF